MQSNRSNDSLRKGPWPSTSTPLTEDIGLAESIQTQLRKGVLELCVLTLLSRAEVSKILPMTAFDYIVVALLAQMVLAEPVTPARWTGIGFIVLGVFLVSHT